MNKKKSTISFSGYEEDMQKYRDAANSRGMTISSYVRSKLNNQDKFAASFPAFAVLIAMGMDNLEAMRPRMSQADYEALQSIFCDLSKVMN